MGAPFTKPPSWEGEGGRTTGPYRQPLLPSFRFALKTAVSFLHSVSQAFSLTFPAYHASAEKMRMSRNSMPRTSLKVKPSSLSPAVSAVTPCGSFGKISFRFQKAKRGNTSGGDNNITGGKAEPQKVPVLSFFLFPGGRLQASLSTFDRGRHNNNASDI